MAARTAAVQLLDGRGEQLGWYRVFIRNRTVLGSLFTLIHLPSMLAFLSVTVIGATAFGSPDSMVLALSLAVVALLLYGEHLLDETTRLGKPWNTVLSDRSLYALSTMSFIAALIIALWASLYYQTAVPIIGVIAGITFNVLYGLEIWIFHTTWFGGLSTGAVPVFSYFAQAFTSGASWDPMVAALLFIFGSCLGYVLLALYEHTKVDDSRRSWILLTFLFLAIYVLAAWSWVMNG